MSLIGRVVVARRWLLTAETRVQSQMTTSEISGGWSDTGAGTREISQTFYYVPQQSRTVPRPHMTRQPWKRTVAYRQVLPQHKTFALLGNTTYRCLKWDALTCVVTVVGKEGAEIKTAWSMWDASLRSLRKRGIRWKDTVQGTECRLD
jgi:hypothetical protein